MLEITKLKASNEALAARVAVAEKPRTLSMKIGDKKALSVYGLNARFPVTLYAEQWLRLIAYMDTIKGFIMANIDQLEWKNGKPTMN